MKFDNNPENYYILSDILPKQPEWKVELFGMGERFVLFPAKGHVPNFFWRWMQYICFGNKWTKE